MVELSDFLGLEEDDDDAADVDDVTQDLEALKGCLKALADAVACTNLAVLANGHGDLQAATSRVNMSVAALKRFADAFAILDAGEETSTSLVQLEQHD